MWSHREQGHRVLRSMVCKSLWRSADSMAEELQTYSGINISTKAVRQEMEWVSMASSTMASVRCNATNGHWSSGNIFCGVKKHFSVWPSLGLADGSRMLPAWLHCSNCNVWWIWWFLFFLGKTYCFSIPRHCRQCIQLCRNSLAKALFNSSMTVPQCIKQGP